LEIDGRYFVLYELLLNAHRFEEIQVNAGISPHLLTSRLRGLEAIACVQRRIYSSRPERFEYWTTDKGRELTDVLFALHTWGMAWSRSGPNESAIQFLSGLTGEAVHQVWQGVDTREAIDVQQVELVQSKLLQHQRSEQKVVFQAKVHQARTKHR